MRPFWKSAILKIGHIAKDIAPAKSSLCVKNQKFQKTCQNSFYKSSRVVLSKKPLQKTPNIREMRPLSKSAIMQRPMQNPHFASKIKSSKKHVKIHSTNHLELFCAKKTLQKTPNIREMRQFLKSVILQRLCPMQRL